MKETTNPWARVSVQGDDWTVQQWLHGLLSYICLIRGNSGGGCVWSWRQPHCLCEKQCASFDGMVAQRTAWPLSGHRLPIVSPPALWAPSWPRTCRSRPLSVCCLSFSLIRVAFIVSVVHPLDSSLIFLSHVPDCPFLLLLPPHTPPPS